ncbi:MAG: hypothetical protein OXC14_06235 [Rhodospirillaceae bacterium]|nr:hypothetical protein [Rhodospirillaceae bacterium]
MGHIRKRESERVSQDLPSATGGQDASGHPKDGLPNAKTPLFEANHADRYQRRDLIRDIQEQTGRTLVCYVSGSRCRIDENDTMPFVDLLHRAPANHDVDLLLHTRGGSVDAAEKLMGMLRRHVGPRQLRVIVPDFAKSAGTLMVLGADSVLMSDMSELGPIDPQIGLRGDWLAVQNYLDAFTTHAQTLETSPDNVAAQIMLKKLDPATRELCEAAVNRARQAAETLLKRGMFHGSGNRSLTVSELLDTTRWRSHGQMISWEDARDHPIALRVEYRAYRSEEWQRYWRLYCLQRLAVGDRQKLYESDYASLVLGPADGE